ncbi:MAG: hypothetical protein SPL96_02800 [Bacteroidales bacterium]|nr:hypothetical protein [Bacteroidales bacterium]
MRKNKYYLYPDAVAKPKKTADYSEKTEMCENVRYQSSMICQIRIFR